MKIFKRIGIISLGLVIVLSIFLISLLLLNSFLLNTKEPTLQMECVSRNDAGDYVNFGELSEVDKKIFVATLNNTKSVYFDYESNKIKIYKNLNFTLVDSININNTKHFRISKKKTNISYKNEFYECELDTPAGVE